MGPLWCQACLVKRHDQSPLHIVEVECSLLSWYALIVLSDVEWVVLLAYNFTWSWPPNTIRTCIWPFMPHLVTCKCYLQGYTFQQHPPHRYWPMSMSWTPTLQTTPTYWLVAGDSTWSKICGYFWGSSTLPPAESAGKGNRLQLLSNIGISNRQYRFTTSSCV